MCRSFLVSLIFLLLSVTNVHAAKITLALNPNSTTEPAGYKLYYGPVSRDQGSYESNTDLGWHQKDVQFDVTLDDLVPGEIYYFAATAYDGSLNESSFSSEVSKTVPPNTPGNNPPIATADSATTNEDAPVTIDVLSNDTDIDGDTLAIASVTQPGHGATQISTGKIVYTPAANYNGADSFNYTVSDGKGGTATGAVTVTVTPANDAPNAGSDSETTNEDASVTINVLANDSDIDGDTLSIATVTQPGHGATQISAGKIVYTPAANYNGADSFNYTVSDGKGGTATAAVTVTVNPANDAPIAAADSATTNEDASVVIDVLANDTDIDGDTRSIASVTQPSHGGTQISAGKIVYTPAANYNGADSFNYTISDGKGGTATAAVTITVTPANDAPTATADSATTNEDASVTIDVLANDTDIDGDTRSIATVTQPGHGATQISTGKIVYTPAANYNGADSFNYTLSDGKGGTATAAVTVTVTPANDAPNAGADSATSNEDASVTIDVLANDTDIDGDTRSIASVIQPGHGGTQISAGKIVYTPAANYNGADSFNYTISDGKGGTATGAVTVTVTPVNDAPIAAADSATTNEDAPVTIDVLSNDTDIDGDTLSIVSVSPALDGILQIYANKVIYSPAADYNGTDTFNYTVSDGKGGTATGAVIVTINSVNDAPIANAGPDRTVTEDAIVTLDGTGSSDPDDGIATYLWTQTSGPSVTIGNPASATSNFSIPVADQSGVILTFQLKITDHGGLSNTDSVNISITNIGDVATVYEDAEDGSIAGWTIYDNDPAGATISNVYDSIRQGRVIKFAGKGTKNGYRLQNVDGSPWNNSSQFVIEWSMNFAENFVIYINVQTTAGQRYLTYKPVDNNTLGTGQYVYLGLGSQAKNGRWQTIVRDLQSDLDMAQPGVKITEVNGFLVRGSGLIDDIKLFESSPKTVYEDAEDGSIAGWTIYDNDPAGAKISNVYDSIRQSGVIKFAGKDTQNGYYFKSVDGSPWHNSSQFMIEWSMNFAEDFVIYINVQTTAGQRYLTYLPVDNNTLGTGQYIYFGIGSNTKSGNWQTVVRDLQTDLEKALPGEKIIRVNSLLIRGSGQVDDINLR